MSSAKPLDLGLKSAYDELFMDDKGREENRLPKIYDIPLSEIDEFPDHPYQVRMDEDMTQLVESVKERGIITPVILRQKKDGRYEMVSGHRRMKACELAGLETVKADIQELTRDEAIVLMVESNLQRSTILPSEKAKAYKMRLEAIKRQGQRSDLTSNPVGGKLKGIETAEIIGDEAGESANQVRRYIRLNELTDELLEFVDEGKIGMRPAVELSYLQEDEMRDLVDFIDDEEVFPSHAQTIRMKALSKEGKLDTDAIREIMLEEKPNQKARIKIPMEKIEKYFPSGTSQQQIEDTIVKALALYRQRQKENRDAR